MASLNDDVTDDLEAGFDPAGLVTPPMKTSGQSDVIIATSSDCAAPITPVSNQALFGKGLELGTVPDINAEFAIVEQNRVHLVDLKEVEEAILGRDAISQEDAVLIDSTFGSFFSTRLSQEEFTRAPSKTNFPYASVFIRKRIAKEEVVIFENLANFVEKPIAELKQFQAAIDAAIPQIREAIEASQAQFSDVIKTIHTSKNTIFPVGELFVNLITTPVNELPLEKFDFKAIGGLPEASANFLKAVEVLQTVFQEAHLPYFIDMVVRDDEGLAAQWVHYPQQCLRYLPRVTLGDLVAVYQTYSVFGRLSSLSTEVTQAIRFFESRHAELQELAQDFATINDYILTHTTDIVQVSRRIQVLHDVVKNMVIVNSAMKPIFTFLAYCH